MKKICWLLILVLLISCLSACQSSQLEQPYSDRLTESQKEEIESAWWQAMGGEWVWYDEERDGGRYYGSENGYIFLFKGSVFTAKEHLKIADYDFIFGNLFNIYAYKDGTFHKLQDVYRNGDVTESAIRAVWEAHKNHLLENFPTIYDIYYGKQQLYVDSYPCP